MKIGDVCNRIVIYVHEDESVQRAAELMRKYHVGNLVVTELDDERQMPVGIVTDRDIVVEVIAKGVDPNELTVGDIMSKELELASEGDDVSDVLDAMRESGIRRMPVVDSAGALVGVLALDDLLQLYAADLSTIAAIVGTQRHRESAARA